MSKIVSSNLPLSGNGRNALDVATEAARKAGDIIKTHLSGIKNIESKGNRNLVTNIDLLADKCITEILNHEFPEHAILCEESAKKETGSDYCWIIDPLDGTTNFAFGIPHVAVSVGLTFRDDILLGVIYDPVRDEMFKAEKGKGSFLNDSLIVVKNKKKPKTTLIGADLGYDDSKTQLALAKIHSFWSSDKVIRLMGSAALGLAYVACGRFDFYFHPSVHPWDTAGGILLIREAGGEVTDWRGNPATVWDDKLFSSGNAKDHQKSLAAIIG